MSTTNERVRDDLIRHQIGLMRLSGSLRNRVFALLTNVEKDIQEQLGKRLERLVNEDGVDFTPVVRRRLKRLEQALQDAQAETWTDINAVIKSELLGLSNTEARLIQGIIKNQLPVEVGTSLPSADLLTAIVTQDPFEGQPLREWLRRLRTNDLNRTMQQIRIGLVRGESSQDITRRVLGTRRGRGTDGIREVTRRGAAALTRTAVNHVGNRARQAFYEANAELIPQELYVSTLDGRTSSICRSLDGQVFEIGVGPTPPVHINCRSLRVPVINGQVLGERPAVAATENELEGLSRRQRRARIRDLTGRVPAAQSYEEFLRNQPIEFQEDVLGVQKARLFRDGDLRLDRFVDRRGNELTLDELRSREGDAFRLAGLI